MINCVSRAGEEENKCTLRVEKQLFFNIQSIVPVTLTMKKVHQFKFHNIKKEK
jgi:hypothetical protein